MLKQPERESRIENRCIQKLNKALSGVELTKSEEKHCYGLQDGKRVG